MRREDFEHVIGAAAKVIGEDAFVVIGSQAILGLIADPPAALLTSMEWAPKPHARRQDGSDDSIRFRFHRGAGQAAGRSRIASRSTTSSSRRARPAVTETGTTRQPRSPRGWSRWTSSRIGFRPCR
jgi:hypothetical protein